MLRNWVVQFGHAPGDRAGDERVSPEDRGKYISQVGYYFGWQPPPGMSWIVEVTKDLHGKHPGRYIACFMRYMTDGEAEKMLGNNYEKYQAPVVKPATTHEEFLRGQLEAIQKQLTQYEQQTQTTEVSENCEVCPIEETTNETQPET